MGRWIRLRGRASLAALFLSATVFLLSGPVLAKASLDAYRALGEQYDVTIRRDRLGVPHVHGRTDADAAFGLAFAQAEDAWPLMLETMRFNRGVAAQTQGRKAALGDYLVKLLRFEERVAAGYDSQLSPATRRYVEAYADGVNYFIATRGARRDRWLLPVTGQDVVLGFAVRHLLFFGLQGEITALNEATTAPPVAQPPTAGASAPDKGPLRAGVFDRNGLPLGSNAIAVGPGKSSDGATRLAINSHQPATGPLAWYEAHISSDDGLDFMGGQFPGSPQISLGFNRHLAWGVTVNKPDLIDVYRLTINPDNPLQYRLDGRWVDFEERTIKIRVKLLGPLKMTVRRKALYSVHGPVLETDHGSYGIRVAGWDQIAQVEQWLAMNRARNFEEWRAAMAQHSFASFNFVYADRTGNIYFVHNARMPKRLPGWDYSGVLPGDRSDLVWDDVVPFDELPQVLNPESGFLHSANQTPFYVSGEGDNPDPRSIDRPQDYPSRITNRAVRGIELLEAAQTVSAETFSAIKHDKAYSENSRAYRYLSQLFALPDLPAKLKPAVALLRSWDRQTDLDNRSAALAVCVISVEWLAEQAGKPAPPVVPVLEGCIEQLTAAVGRIDPRWGEVNRHVRGDLNLPLAGGPDTLRAIYGDGLEKDGFLTNRGGDGLYYLVTFAADGSLSVLGTHQFGANPTDPRSPHYADQARDFAEERLRAPLFQRAALEANLERSYRP